MGSEKLKGCPFCNGPAVNVAGEYVTCGSPTFLDCAGRSVKAEPAAWNTRAPADLRSALEPFAREADAQERVTSFSSGDSVIPRTSITIGQLRRARAAFAALAPTKGDAS